MNSTSTMNVTTSVVLPDLSLEFRVVKISIYVVIFVLTIIGNGLVISVIRNDRRMRSSSHILVFNLAICDLITPTISLPFDLAYEEMHYEWPFGPTMCKLLWPSQTFSATSSVLILTAICIDRYRALVYPFKIRWAGKFCFMVCAIYAVSIAVVTPYILVLLLSKNGDKFDCIEKWPNPQKKFRQAYTIVLFLLQYALPLVLMITLYSITLRSLFNNNKSFPGMKAGAGEKEPSSNESHPEAEKRTNTLKELRKEQHLKVTKMFITVVIVFAISMFPNQVFWLWVDFGNLSVKYHFSITSIICRIFTYSNSVLNPFIYGLYSKEFRKGYKKAGRRVHRQTPFYYTQTKKAGHLGTPTTSLLESRTKLIPTANTNGITLEPIDTKRVQFCSEKDEKTKRDEESLKEIHLSNDETQKDSNIIKDSGNGLDFNSNSKRTTFDDADEKENTQSELIEDIYNSINSQTPMKCDDLDERVVEYFGELQETSC